MNEPTTNENIMTVKQAATYLNLSNVRILGLFKEGKLKGTKTTIAGTNIQQVQLDAASVRSYTKGSRSSTSSHKSGGGHGGGKTSGKDKFVGRRTIRAVLSHARLELLQVHVYSVVVKIGMIPYRFTVRQHSNKGYSVMKGADIIGDFDENGRERALTLLADQIGQYL